LNAGSIGLKMYKPAIERLRVLFFWRQKERPARVTQNNSQPNAICLPEGARDC
jgi:hypothetical protein